ncbi:MAG: RelA/SpoT family protein [Methylococcaceae bacterium]
MGIVSDYLEQEFLDTIAKAYQFGDAAHQGQVRKSGEPYICHPLSVAIILAKMKMDANGIIAGVLHDVLEDTQITKEQLVLEFNSEVAELVDAVTKLTKIDFKTQAEAQAENVRKMFLAMVKDLRVIIVKLADRLHNMRTLEAMPRIKKRRIAKETLDIYVPLAHRLGMNIMRQHLEMLGFETLYPMRFKVLDKAVNKGRGNRKEVIAKIELAIGVRLVDEKLECDVIGREKNLYSIYKKMLSKKKLFTEVFDVYGFRILCHDVGTCYRILGVVHNLYSPVPGRFKDYIATPKANGYQSLHTVLITPFGTHIEIQIRTNEMNTASESGIAAHWLYKANNEHAVQSQVWANEWLNDFLETHQSLGDSLEFIDNLKIDLYPQEVYVFTPQGKIIKLPKGATVVDFAFTVHTDIGNSCVSARIDHELVSLQTILENGMTVEVITATWARPNPQWLLHVVTAKARAGIRNYLRNFKRQEAIQLGKRLLEKELLGLGIEYEKLEQEVLANIIRDMGLEQEISLFEDIGLGNRMPFIVAQRFCRDSHQATFTLDASEETSSSKPLMIKGTEDVVVNLAKCCKPIPGDPILGFFSPGRGIVIHYAGCKNSNEVRKKQTGWINAEWSEEIAKEFSAELRVDMRNKHGSLATVAAAISSMDSNIENVSVVAQDHEVSVDKIILSVKNRVHLANVIRQLKKLNVVLKINRVKA